MGILDLGLYKKTGRKPKKKNFVMNSRKNISELTFLQGNEHIKTLALFYGTGDGGKGPLEHEINFMVSLANYKRSKLMTTYEFFKMLEKKIGDEIVSWDDELYLEYHRGCLTTQAKIKKESSKSVISLLSPRVAMVNSLSVSGMATP